MKSLPNWQGIAEFVCIVESGSFTAAAARLSISTAQVSRQLAQLEQRLGVQLLHRTTRKIRVSELGKRYYQQCRQLMDGFDDAEHLLLERQSIPRGKLRLTAPITYGERVLMPLLNQLLLLHPQLQFEVELTNAQLDIVDTGFDLAIRLGRLSDSRLRARKLASRNVYTCCSSGYLRQHGQPYTLSELKHHNCLLGSRDHWRFSTSQGEQRVKVSGNLRCNSGHSLVDAALKDIGIVQLPEEYVVSRLHSGALTAILTAYQPESEGIWGLYPDTRWVSPNVVVVLDYLAQQLSRAEPSALN